MLSLSLSRTHTHTLSLTVSHIHTLLHTRSLSHTLSHTYTLPVFVTHSHIQTHTVTYILSHTHTHTSLSLSFLSLSLTHAQSLFLFLYSLLLALLPTLCSSLSQVGSPSSSLLCRPPWDPTQGGKGFQKLTDRPPPPPRADPDLLLSGPFSLLDTPILSAAPWLGMEGWGRRCRDPSRICQKGMDV